MFTLMLLFGVLIAGGAVILAVIAVLGFTLRLATHLVLLPLKLIFVPILAVVVIVKLAVLLALGAALVALLVPLAILLAILVAPFALVHAIF